MGTDGRARGVVPGVLLLSASAMAGEIVLIRLLSLRFWPHFVSLIVSQAMLGFGAAGVVLHLNRDRVARAPGPVLAWTALLAAPSFELAVRASHAVPFDPFLLLWDPGAWPAFALFFAILAVPFFLAGGVVAAALSFTFGRPGTVYAAGFAGSALGAILPLPAFSLLPPGSLTRLPVALGVAGAACLLGTGGPRGGRLRAAALVASLVLFALPPPPLSLSPYKDLALARRLPGAVEIAARGGPSGDFRALSAPGIHSAPGLALTFAGVIPPQAAVFADGESRGIVPRRGGGRPPAYLDHLPSALPYRLVDRPAVLQLGLPGTERVLAAALGGAASVTVAEPAPELVALVTRDLAAFSGGWPEGLRVEVAVAGARQFLAREGPPYDLVEIPELSSPSFAAAGIHATGETFLLTREGIRAALGRLTDDGVLAVSGWVKAPPREAAKMLATVRDELSGGGGGGAGDRAVVVRGWGSFAAAFRKRPFTEVELRRAARFCEERGFALVWPPRGGAQAARGPGEKAFRDAVAAALGGGPGISEDGLFDVRPATDDSPYFHRFVRIGALPALRRLLGPRWVPYVEWGIVFLLLSLAVSLLLSALFLLGPVPFHRRGRPRRGGVSRAAYFTALGLGYMLAELSFLKAGILLVGSAMGAASAAIGGFAFFSGLGSAFSHRVEGERPMARRVFPGLAAAVGGGFLFLSLGAPRILPLPDGARIALFLAALAPGAFLMGMPFPAGLSRLAKGAPGAIPLAFGINGFFSVAGATLASVGAIWAGLRATVAAAVVLYLAAGALYGRLGAGGEDPAGVLPREPG